MNGTQVDELSQKHADLNSRLLDNSLFDYLTTSVVGLTDNKAIKKLYLACQRIKDSCRDVDLGSIGQAKYRIPSRKPGISLSEMRYETQHQEAQPESSPRQDAETNFEQTLYYDVQESPSRQSQGTSTNQKSPVTPQVQRQRVPTTPRATQQQRSLTTPRADHQFQTPRAHSHQVPTTPRTLPQATPSPRTPENTGRPQYVTAPAAPRRPTGRSVPYSTLPRQSLFNRSSDDDAERPSSGFQAFNTPVSRPNAERVRNRLALRPPTPRVHTSTPNTIRMPDISFRVLLPSPNESAIRSIECDRNLSNREITQVNQIIDNITEAAGDDAFPNGTVAVSTRNLRISPGKYKLYKVMRF